MWLFVGHQLPVQDKRAFDFFSFLNISVISALTSPFLGFFQSSDLQNWDSLTPGEMPKKLILPPRKFTIWHLRGTVSNDIVAAYFVLDIRAPMSPSSPEMTQYRQPSKDRFKGTAGTRSKPHISDHSLHSPRSRVGRWGRYTHETLRKQDTKLKTEALGNMMQPAAQHLHQQNELLGISEDVLNKINCILKSCAQYQVKNGGTAHKWRYLTGIHSCNSTAGRLGKEKHPRRPSSARYRTHRVCSKQLPGAASCLGNGF